MHFVSVPQTPSRGAEAAPAQASLAWWAVVSPFTPYGPTIALVFVLLVAATKAAAEDRKRHAEDRRTNNSVAHVVQADGAPRTSIGVLWSREVARELWLECPL